MFKSALDARLFSLQKFKWDSTGVVAVEQFLPFVFQLDDGSVLNLTVLDCIFLNEINFLTENRADALHQLGLWLDGLVVLLDQRFDAVDQHGPLGAAVFAHSADADVVRVDLAASSLVVGDDQS